MFANFLKGRAAIITGSTSGIGLGIAQQLAAAGADIVLNGFADAPVVKGIQKEITEAYGVRVIYHGADVTKPDQVSAMVALCAETFGTVDIVVNNAGIQFVAPIEDFPLEKWNAVIGTNLSAAFYATRAALPHMRKNGWGRIINIASAHGLVASAEKAAYVAAKHGIIGLTKVTALETATVNITANAICPGWVLTPLVQKQVDAIAAKDGIDNDTAKIKLLSAKQPSGQFAQPENIGDTAVFLCSDAAAQITGATIEIDGGWTSQ